MSLLMCAACTTSYAHELDACPHCGSSDATEEGHPAARRLPLFVSVACTACGRGPWQLRLALRMTGLVELPALFCASCGHGVQVPWPPVEDDMPKITVSGGATNARDAEPSPGADASEPLVGAEADQGHPTTETEPEPEAVVEETPAEDEAPVEDASSGESAPVADYEGMTLAELRELAVSRDLPSWGTKAQVTERLREADEA